MAYIYLNLSLTKLFVIMELGACVKIFLGVILLSMLPSSLVVLANTLPELC